MPVTEATYSPRQIFAASCPKPVATRTITVAQGQTLLKGQVMGIVTSSGLAKAYNPAAVTGEEKAVGVLDRNVDTSSTNLNRDCPAGLIYGNAHFLQDQLIGLDDDAIADMKAQSTFGNVLKLP